MSELALVGSFRSRRGPAYGIDDPDGAVVVLEDLVGHAPNVRLGDLVDLVEIAEEFAPVAVARLIDGELLRQALVLGEAADQVGLGACLEHLQLVVGHILRLQLVDLLVDRLLNLGVGVPGRGTA